MVSAMLEDTWGQVVSPPKSSDKRGSKGRNRSVRSVGRGLPSVTHF